MAYESEMELEEELGGLVSESKEKTNEQQEPIQQSKGISFWTDQEVRAETSALLKNQR